MEINCALQLLRAVQNQRIVSNSHLREVHDWNIAGIFKPKPRPIDQHGQSKCNVSNSFETQPGASVSIGCRRLETESCRGADGTPVCCAAECMHRGNATQKTQLTAQTETNRTITFIRSSLLNSEGYQAGWHDNVARQLPDEHGAEMISTAELRKMEMNTQKRLGSPTVRRGRNGTVRSCCMVIHAWGGSFYASLLIAREDALSACPIAYLGQSTGPFFSGNGRNPRDRACPSRASRSSLEPA